MKTDALRVSLRRWLGAAAAVLLVAAASCADAGQRKLRQMVGEQSGSCPMAVAEGVAVDNVSYSGDVVVYEVTVDAGMQVAQLNANAEVARRLVADALMADASPEVRAELEACRDAGATMRYVLRDSTGATFTIDIDPAQYLNDK